MDNKLFLIGEVAKIYHISMGTLRHYEQAGLLTPEYTDPRTGYRYYGARQLEVLNTIRYLRVLDFPLSEIADFLHNRDVRVMEEKLVQQKALIERKQQELELIARKLDHRLEQLRDASGSELNRICLIDTPARRMVWLRDRLQLHSYLDLENSIRRLQQDQKEPLVFLGKVGVGISKELLDAHKFDSYDQVFLLLDDEDRYEGATAELPAAHCAAIRFCGSHSEAPAYYLQLMDYLHANHLQTAGASQEITLIDNGLTSDTSKFITEIRIPVIPEV